MITGKFIALAGAVVILEQEVDNCHRQGVKAMFDPDQHVLGKSVIDTCS